ncbi:MAG: heat shock protein transcriptional repressor HspR [Chloroflexota bacterium]
MNERDEPCYVISIAAKMVNMHPQTLRYYERLGLVEPSRTQGRIRLYSDRDIHKLQHIQRLMSELGVNLAGVEVIMNMTERIYQMENEMKQMQARMEAEIERLRAALEEREA